mmetsp:Transcript_19173/g.31899  ORF Transcript_19173/g.31899 Transcript_19173/m.31899 type:complete len:99 (-) Transcript_19173:1556-1852(-)
MLTSGPCRALSLSMNDCWTHQRIPEFGLLCKLTSVRALVGLELPLVDTSEGLYYILPIYSRSNSSGKYHKENLDMDIPLCLLSCDEIVLQPRHLGEHT